MKNKRNLSNCFKPALLSAVMASLCGPALAADSLAEAFSEGKAKFDLRYRYETVDQDPFARDATASTLRARLNYTTADFRGLSFQVEYDYVAELLGDKYDAGGGNTPNRGQYPVVADPDGDDLNQAFLQFRNGETTARLGRQRIILDNARFVGNVGWRQNPQTYDAFSVVHETGNGVKITGAVINNVNRIFGDEVSAGDHSHETFLVNLGKKFEGVGTLTAYHYAIDNEDAAGLSNKTFGARLSGNRKAGERDIGYTLEFASQQEHGNNPVAYDADYFRFDISAGFGAATLYAGFESLEGDANAAGQAFRTPLATLHAFNGWADKFLTTPGAGLEDTFVGARGKAGEWSWNILYHDFAAQSGSGDFGSELDVSFSRALGKHYGVLLKAADFDSDNAAYGDTTKFWLQLTAGF